MGSEYRGQKVIATYQARMIPPNNSYPDCVCMIVLTQQHLYVLEDNFDGTCEIHFDFVVREIDDVEIELHGKEKSSGNQAALLSKQLITAAACVIAGAIPIPDETRKKMVKRELLAISYHDVQGKKCKLYFNINNPGAKKFIKMFHKVKGQ